MVNISRFYSLSQCTREKPHDLIWETVEKCKTTRTRKKQHSHNGWAWSCFCCSLFSPWNEILQWHRTAFTQFLLYSYFRSFPSPSSYQITSIVVEIGTFLVNAPKKILIQFGRWRLSCNLSAWSTAKNLAKRQTIRILERATSCGRPTAELNKQSRRDLACAPLCVPSGGGTFSGRAHLALLINQLAPFGFVSALFPFWGWNRRVPSSLASQSNVMFHALCGVKTIIRKLWRTSRERSLHPLSLITGCQLRLTLDVPPLSG